MIASISPDRNISVFEGFWQGGKDGHLTTVLQEHHVLLGRYGRPAGAGPARDLAARIDRPEAPSVCPSVDRAMEDVPQRLAVGPVPLQPFVESNDVWGRSNGRLRSIGAMTAGRLWNTFGTPWHEQDETFGYLDLGKVVRVTHMTYDPSDPANAWKIDIAASTDGKCPLDFTDILSIQHFSSLGDIGSSYGIEPELATVYDLSHHHEGLPYERTIEDDLRALVAWRDATKPTMPIWLTEAGFDRGYVNEYLQACWLPRGVMMALAAGIDKVQISGERGTRPGGVVRNDATLKPAWFTYATMVRQLDGATGRALRLPTDENVRAYLWKRGDRAILTAWTAKGTGEFKTALGRCTLTDAFGASQPADVRRPG